MIADWKKSITGLIKLADQNLHIAEDELVLKEHKRAIQSAATSVENITRALIHCYGTTADNQPGQEEILRMLTTRFQGKEKDQGFNVASASKTDASGYRILAKYVEVPELMAPERVLLSNIERMKQSIQARRPLLLCLNCGYHSERKASPRA
jgi:hypothetical protein